MEYLILCFFQIIALIFYAAPIASIFYFIICLVNFRASKVSEIRKPEKWDPKVHNTKLVRLIISVVIMAVVIISEASIIIYLSSAVAFM